jgi:hypothetical protein
VQAADQPDHAGNKQEQAKNAAKAGPAIPAVTIVATASEQQNQQDDNQNCTHVTPSLKFQFILEVSFYGFRTPDEQSSIVRLHREVIVLSGAESCFLNNLAI